jgi:hypothetical protein
MNLLEWQQLGIHFFMFTFAGIAITAFISSVCQPSATNNGPRPMARRLPRD